MGKIDKSLKIIYNIKDRLNVAYISEFYKLCGFLVSELETTSIMKFSEDLKEELEEYNYILFVGGEESLYEDIFVKGMGSYCLIKPLLYDFSTLDRQEHKVKLKKMLLEITYGLLQQNSEAMSYLIQSYVENRYFIIAHTKRYFLKMLAMDEKQQLLTVLLNMRNRIELQEEELKADDFFVCFSYAKLLCSKKINDLCRELNMNFCYSPGKLIGEVLRLTNYEEDFLSAYVLAAELCCCDPDFYESVADFYNKAFQIGRDASYMAPFYYKFGKFLESKKGDYITAGFFYEKAIKADTRYYRAIFKGARKLENTQCFNSAIMEYKKIIAILELKLNADKLFPIEYEYLCKCYSLIGIIYSYYLGDGMLGRLYKEKALEIKVNNLGKSKIFEQLFGIEEKKYREETERRIRERAIVIDNLSES